MNDNAEQQRSTSSAPISGAAPGSVSGVSVAYAASELAKAHTTARTHHDPATRTRAQERGKRWRAVLAGMADGSLRIGSRTPVADLPAWVTPEVVRGGFATGAASASGPLEPYERELAQAFGVPAERGALFAYALTEDGLDWLGGLLDSGRYHVALPEEAALLTVAWLVRHGALEQAVDLVGELGPFAGRLRFLPRPAPHARPETDAVHRRTVGEVRATLDLRRPNEAVEAQREAITVWQPFEDELLALWLETAGSPEHGDVLALTPDEDWHRRAAALHARHEELAAAHHRCTKRRAAKSNLGIMRTALEEIVGSRDRAGRNPGARSLSARDLAEVRLTPRRFGLLRHAVVSVVRKRGLPGSSRHGELRAAQALQAARPSHHALAQLVSHRLARLPQEAGVRDLAPLLARVGADEERDTGLPEGAALPDAVRKAVEPALSAPVETLVARGVVPSAEVLAQLVPQLVAAATAQAYPEGALRDLADAGYRAFRNRRSLLLLHLQHQVRIGELPWVRGILPYRSDEAVQAPARQTYHRVAALAVAAFPATLLPNPLIRELSVLARESGLDAPLVEELAADIFEGTFSGKYLAAAGVAARVLRGSVYERYYGIDYAGTAELARAAKQGRDAAAAARAGFAQLCARRAGGGGDGWSVAANGKVIEQAQILTTHNLAVLESHVGGMSPAARVELVQACFVRMCALVRQVPGNRAALRKVKDAAYAWRQLLFHLSLCEPVAQRGLVTWLEEELARQPAEVGGRLALAVGGLRHVVDGGMFDENGDAGPGARRFLGWSTRGHWLLRGTR